MSKTDSEPSSAMLESEMPSVDAGTPAHALDHPRKRQIIQAFRNVLIREGCAATSMRRVAEECDMKLGNLQYYFATRDELIDAFISHWIALEQTGRGALLNESKASVESILLWIDGAFTHFIQRNCENMIATIELTAMAYHSEKIKQLMSKWYSDENSYYAMMIRMALPHLSKQASEQRASTIMALLEGMAAQLAMRESISDRDIEASRAALLDATTAILGAGESK